LFNEDGAFFQSIVIINASKEIKICCTEDATDSSIAWKFFQLFESASDN